MVLGASQPCVVWSRNVVSSFTSRLANLGGMIQDLSIAPQYEPDEPLEPRLS